MPYEYYSYGDTYGADAVFSIFGIVYGFFLLIGLLAYVLEAAGLHTIAKRRGIRNYGLAWLPIANVWILGSIADQYMFVSTGMRKNYRKILLGLSIGFAVTIFFSVICLFGSVLAEAVRAENGASEDAVLRILGPVLLIWLLIMVLAVVISVFTFVAYYRLFQSCAPYNATLYLVLSIFVSVTLPFFIFACRNKDDGMRPCQPPMYGAPPAGPGGPGFQPLARTVPDAYPGQVPQQPVNPPTVQTPPEEAAEPKQDQDSGPSWL